MASYPVENQSVVPSSKRNTAYLLPLNNNPPVLAKKEQNQNEEVKLEQPFPKPNISHKTITKNSGKIISNTSEETFSDEEDSTDEELINEENKINSTPNNNKRNINYENRPILLFQTPTSNGSSTESPPPIIGSPIKNIHSNQYYDHCPKNREQTALTTESPTSSISLSTVHEPKSPVVSIIQHNSSNDKQKSHMNNSKILIPKKIKSNKDKSKPDAAEKISKISEQRQQSPEINVVQQMSSLNLNQSGSSGSEVQDLRQPTRVSAKIQQLLNTLKVNFK